MQTETWKVTVWLAGLGIPVITAGARAPRASLIPEKGELSPAHENPSQPGAVRSQLTHRCVGEKYIEMEHTVTQ